MRIAILTQTKDQIVIDPVHIGVPMSTHLQQVYASLHIDGYTTLGTYETRERCLEIIQDIMRAISQHENNFIMPEK